MGVYIVKPPACARSPLFGGHTICHEGIQQWSCSVCYGSSDDWDTFALAKCRGPRAEKWALPEVAAAEAVGEVGPGHHRMLAGELVWCLKCGCYGEARGRGLATVCRGRPTDLSGGGLAGQLRYLQAGKHPKTFEDMPHRWMSVDASTSRLLSLLWRRIGLSKLLFSR